MESVVNIHTEKAAPADKESRFFTQKPRRVTGMGTGIVVDERGYIVTNYHVIHDVDQITVTLQNGETLAGRKISFDRKHDMAIIHIDPTKPLTVMPLGTSSDVMLAEQVFAVGNAFGYEHTVTSGIVSAIGRDVEVDETQSYENLIQTDASINPGNSGGPLLNVNGQVIGINVAIRAGAQRIGFALPIDEARRTIARLLSTERLSGVSHGVFTTDVKTPTEQKLVIDDVMAGSAAAICGLKNGDVLTEVRGIRIRDTADWERGLLDIPVGTVVDVSILRKGVETTLPFTVGIGKSVPNAVAAPATPATPATPVKTVASVNKAKAASSPSEIRNRVASMLGLRLASLHTQDRKIIGRKYKGGMRVTAADSGGLAARHGIRRGDILLGLDGYETLDDRNLQFILLESRIKNLKSLSFQIFRQHHGALVGSIELPSTRQ
ncbi:MAG: trypsin-like peptidase domain-containing protein [Fuerstiella sp.]|nr:trypsin-like peptidase domain-containing protein [Fuerstiella sp.]